MNEDCFVKPALEQMQERYELALSRIEEISKEHFEVPEIEEYFTNVANFLLFMGETWDYIAKGRIKQESLEELKAYNRRLYQDILPENYKTSFANPAYAIAKLGSEFGGMLSFLLYEMRSLIGFAYEQRLEDMVIRMELFLEVYAAFTCAWQETKKLPNPEEIQQIIYWYVFDYADIAAMQRVKELLLTENNFAVQILQDTDCKDIRYLFYYGEYITENEIETARYLASLPKETIDLIANTYTEGYRMGFELAKKDLKRKKTVDIRYTLGFERIIKKAIENFAKLGLSPAIYRSAVSILHNPAIYKSGFIGANPNKQYDFDHKDDKALFLDKNMVNRKLEVFHTALEKYKEQALLYAGPAVMETFGEANFKPVYKAENYKLTSQQQNLWVEYRSHAGQIQRKYILEEERSFTIIAFPVPEIGERFPEIFDEIIRINTLDYKQYQKIQQTIIDTLDTAKYCEVKGRNGNRTNLRISLHPLKNPEKETIFENCVADVNIPVGEVFTSPVLKGTNGILHVSRVFLEGLEYHNLAITFEDGMIKDYTCSNFEKEEENKNFIQENILFHHKTLPMGEFAIGTNTTAYVAAKKFGIEEKLPILIAEKMGPHFAVGDTCYSHLEEISVYNPDGKEIVARDNEISMLRNTDLDNAYFNCHTDITIPYNELGELSAVLEDGSRKIIIENGRFVLLGCEALNQPFLEEEKKDE